MVNNYTVGSIIFAIQHKDELIYSSSVSGNYDSLIAVEDAENYVIKANLTERQAEIFDMYYKKDLTLATIGETLGISYQGVADCLASCKKKLKKVLDKEEQSYEV